MKKLFCVMLVALGFAVSVNAQDESEKKSSLLIYAGPQLSTASCGGGATLSGKFSYLAGIQYERKGIFGEDFGLYGGLEYSAKGTKGLEVTGGREDKHDLNYLQLNLGVMFAKEIWGIDGFAQVGPYVAYGIGGSSEVGDHEMSDGPFDDINPTSNGFYYDGGLGFKKLDVGLNIAVGAEFSGFRIMAGYQFGLTDIADEHYLTNGYKNNGYYAKVGYAFKF